MNVSRILVTSAVALSVAGAIGCSSTHKMHEADEARTAAAPVPVAIAEPTPMPLQPAVQDDRSTVVAVSQPAPVIVTNEPAVNVAAADFTERAPQADRN